MKNQTMWREGRLYVRWFWVLIPALLGFGLGWLSAILKIIS